MSAACIKFEEYEVRPLFQVARAAMSGTEYSQDALTREGVMLLLDIIEDRVYPKPQRTPRRKRK